MVTLVQENSQGSSTGLQKGDVLLRYHQATPASPQQLIEAVSACEQDPSCTQPTAEIFRAGEVFTVSLQPGKIGIGITAF